MLNLKKIIYSFILFFMVFILAITFVANSSFMIRKVVDMFAPEYNLSYEEIKGNVFTGVSISGVKYNNNLLSKKVTFSWNPSKLLYKRVAISELTIEELDIDVVKSLIASFPNDNNSSSTALSVGIFADKMHLDVRPFMQEGIVFSKIILDIRNVAYTEKKLDIGNVHLEADTNVAQVLFEASLNDEKVLIDKLMFEEIDSATVEKLFLTYEDTTKEENNIETVESTHDIKDESFNAYIPREIKLKYFFASMNPRLYRLDKDEEVDIASLFILAKEIIFDTSTMSVKKGFIDLNGTTNLSNILYHGDVKDNQLKGNIVLSPTNRLYEFYKLPLRKDAIGDITVDIDVNEENIVAELKAKAKQVFMIEKDTENKDGNSSKSFNMDIDNLVSYVVFTFKNNTLKAESKVIISTPYAKDISISNTFLMDKNVSYKGTVKVKEPIGVDAKYTKALHHLKINYTGSLNSINADISSDGLRGSFISHDFRKANFHLASTKTIMVNEMVFLPDEINETKADIIIDIPLDFDKIMPIQAKVKMISNITNIHADIIYGESLQAKIMSNIPESSLLKNFDKNIKWNAMNPMTMDLHLTDKEVNVNLASKELSSKVKYRIENGKMEGTVKLSGLLTDIRGSTKEKITVHTKVHSVKSLMVSLQSFYVLDNLPPLEGALDLSIDVLNLKEVDLTLSSPKIMYKLDRKTENMISDVEVVVSADTSQVKLKSYSLTYNEMPFFSTKPSIVNIKEGKIEIKEFWVNDQFKVVGNYNTKTKKGQMSSDAKKLHIAHEFVELDADMNVRTLLDGNKTSINGNIVLLGGNIFYDLGTKNYPSDSDIIIVQDMKKDEESPFVDNLSMNVNIQTKKPLIYKQGPMNIKVKVDVSAHKAEFSDLTVLGEVTLIKGGSYTFEGKKFVLDKSNIYFTGNPNKPLLDIRVKYKSLNHLITIGITGTPTAPNITFSSVPSLKKEQILSIILFDSEDGAGTNSGEDMMKMMGGAMAKSALSDLGIKLDHLAIGADGSVEVGKKITDKITFIYVNDEIPQVRVKYQHSPRTESVISADEISQAYDIVYKKDFSEDDIVIFGK